MSRATSPRFPTRRVILSALAGGGLALTIGLIAVTLAPDNGFADLALAAITKVYLVPLGLVVGGVFGWRRGSRRR